MALSLDPGLPSALGADEPLSGHAVIIDGDTFRFAGTKIRIRLHGVDAPEAKQFCERDAGCYPCGEDAKAALASITKDHDVRCERIGKSYNRIVARCFVGDTDIAEAMIENGWVVVAASYLKKAEKDQYISVQNVAKERGAGMLAGQFVVPGEWRNRGRRLECEPPKTASP